MDGHTADTLAFNGEWNTLDCFAVRWMWAMIYVEGDRTQWRTHAVEIAYNGVGVPYNVVQWRRNGAQ